MPAQVNYALIERLKDAKGDAVLSTVHHGNAKQIIRQVVKELAEILTRTNEIDVQYWDLLCRVTCCARDSWRAHEEGMVDDVPIRIEDTPPEEIDEAYELNNLYSEAVENAKYTHSLFKQFANKLETVRTDQERRVIIESLKSHWWLLGAIEILCSAEK